MTLTGSPFDCQKVSQQKPEESVVFTIGHSTHSIEKFVAMLQKHAITALVDVRSVPYSGRHPQFSKEALAACLSKVGIDYVFLGEELGARPDDPTCFDNDQVDFDRLAARDLFKRGLDQVLEGSRTRRIALMCAEREPLDCHRTILVCRHLAGHGVRISHILADGSLEDHLQTEARLMRITGTEGDLFDRTTRSDLLEQAYVKRARQIAHKRRGEEVRHV